jgi:hypothetical protein
MYIASRNESRTLNEEKTWVMYGSLSLPKYCKRARTLLTIDANIKVAISDAQVNLIIRLHTVQCLLRDYRECEVGNEERYQRQHPTKNHYSHERC